MGVLNVDVLTAAVPHTVSNPKCHSRKIHEGDLRISFALFLMQVDSTTKGASALVDTLEFHDRTKNAAKFTAWSHYPCHLSFAIRSISLGVDRWRVKDSLTLLSLAVRPSVCSVQLPTLACLWVVFIRKDEMRGVSEITRKFCLIKSHRQRRQKWQVSGRIYHTRADQSD